VVSNRIELNVPCTPVGMPRGRARAFQTKGGKWASRVYHPTTAGKDGKYKNFVRAAEFKSAIVDALGMVQNKWTGPVRVDIDVYFDRPKYLQKKSSPASRIPHTSKPDRDNVDKCVLDSLTEAGLFEDDAQVCAGYIQKWWIPKGGTPGVFIVAESLVRVDTMADGVV
jgi:Holliday junction resolvase RusA-like endonuclease